MRRREERRWRNERTGTSWKKKEEMVARSKGEEGE